MNWKKSVLLAGAALLFGSAACFAAGAAAPADTRPGAGSDPRECLKLPSNVEIAICAERFRPRVHAKPRR